MKKALLRVDSVKNEKIGTTRYLFLKNITPYFNFMIGEI